MAACHVHTIVASFQGSPTSRSLPIIIVIASCCSHSQEFLHYTIYGTSLTDSEEATPLQPSVPPAAVPMPKHTLYPVPSPIASPRPGHMWPGSPSNYAVPSIPPFSVPSPKHGASGIRTGRGGWECELTLEQFKQLLTPPTTPPTNLDGYPDDCSPLEVFLGSLSLLYQFANHVSKFQAGQQTPIPVSGILNIHSSCLCWWQPNYISSLIFRLPYLFTIICMS